MCYLFFFFKQKTAYELRISDWSSDVCSSDLPVLFDCLEFDSALATTDVLYDLAFLLMDLWARGFQAQANLLLNRYLAVSPQDEPGIALMPLFLSIRATIRAHPLPSQDSASPDLALAATALHTWTRAGA